MSIYHIHNTWSIWVWFNDRFRTCPTLLVSPNVLKAHTRRGLGIVFETSGVVLLQKDWRFWCKGWISLIVLIKFVEFLYSAGDVTES